jgi:transcriptional regulator with XRE-family HTH domain
MNMGFRENLKSELSFRGMLVKELAEKSGVSIHTINNYLNLRGRMPAAATAVKIARALEVPVEQLIDGRGQTPALEPELRSHLQTMQTLDVADRTIIYTLAAMLAGRKKRAAQTQSADRAFQLLLQQRGASPKNS